MDFDSDQESITPNQRQYVKINTTGALWLPTGTNAERPSSPSTGLFRYNTDTPGLEYWNGATWSPVGGSSNPRHDFPLVNVYLDYSLWSPELFGGSPALSGGSTPVIDTTASSLFADLFWAEDDIIFITGADLDYQGFWVLGSFASPTAVPLTRVPGFGVGTVINVGDRIQVRQMLNFTNTLTGASAVRGALTPNSSNFHFVTAVDVSNNRLTLATTLEDVQNIIQFTFANAGGETLPGGTAYNTLYYPNLSSAVVVSPTEVRFELYSKLTDSIVDITSTGTAVSNDALFILCQPSFRNLEDGFGYGGKNNNYITFLGEDNGGGDLATAPLIIGTSTFTPAFTQQIGGYGYGNGSVVSGFRSHVSFYGVALGDNAGASDGVAVGDGSSAGITPGSGLVGGVAVGRNSKARDGGIALGNEASALFPQSAAIGRSVRTSNASEFSRRSAAAGNGNILHRSFILGREEDDGGGPAGAQHVALKTIGGAGGFPNESNIVIRAAAEFSGRLIVMPYQTATDVANTIIEFNGYVVRTSDSPYYKIDIVQREVAKSATETTDYLLSATCTATADECLMQLFVDSPGGYTGFVTYGATLELIELLMLPLNLQATTELELQPPTGAVFAVTSASLAAGDWVNIYLDGGVTKIRKASASSAYQVDGFLLNTYGSGVRAIVWVVGINTRVASMTTGSPVYLSTTSGVGTHTIPGAGNLVQKLGIALSTTSVLFQNDYAVQT
jgi:hypothetical protein